MVHAYGSRAYASTLSHFGAPIQLSGAGGCVLQRHVPGCNRTDIAGPYPWAEFDDWSSLDSDLEQMKTGDDRPVSVVLVVSPTSDVDTDTLRATFPDHMVHFKEHFLVELAPGLSAQFRPSHRRKMKRAAATATIDCPASPATFAAAWIELYAQLIDRHDIEGVARFPDEALRRQLDLPECKAFFAMNGTEVLGAVTFMVSGAKAAYHLGAFSPRGYDLEVAFALFPAAFDHLREVGVELVNLGGGAGTAPRSDDGLAQFKRGWSTRSESSLLAGRVVDRVAYEKMSIEHGDSPFFPRYRTPRNA